MGLCEALALIFGACHSSGGLNQFPPAFLSFSLTGPRAPHLGASLVKSRDPRGLAVLHLARDRGLLLHQGLPFISNLTDTSSHSFY